MASLIKIKRTTTANLPSALEQGELVYVYDTSATDTDAGGIGGRLFVGDPTSSSNAPLKIGGKYYTDLLDHTHGTLTASAAIITDSNSKIDTLNVDNLTLDGNTLSSTDTNGNITIDPNGTGYVSIVGTNGLVLPVGDTSQRGPSVQGAVRYNNQTSSFEGYDGAAWGSLGGVIDIDQDTYITAEASPDEDTLRFYNAAVESLSISGTAVNVASTVTTTNINATTASTSTSTGALVVDGGVGIAGDLRVGGLINADSATFSSINNTPVGNTTPSTGAFTTLSSSGEATLASATVSDLTATRVTFAGASGALTDSSDLTFANATLTATNLSVGTQATLASAAISDLTSGRIVLAGASGELNDSANLTFDGTVVTTTEVQVDNINIDQNTISSTNSNGNIVLDPDGTGTVDVNSHRITQVADPVDAQDAATKAYVDAAAEGLAVKPAVKAATTADLSATYDNGTDGVGATLNLGQLASLTIDGVSISTIYDGVLVKDQTNAEENGRYYLSQIGNAVDTDWILTRCGKCDEPSEIPSMYVFVQEGTLYNSTGWVATVDTLPMTVGTDDIVFTQFSGAGTYTAGDGLDLTGTEFAVNVAASGGIEISADALQLKSSVAGAGLTYTNGVVDVVGTTNRITVNANDIDIAATYVGQTSITTLGTIGTGTWQGSVIADAYIAQDLTIVGGTINNTPIGATTPSSGAFTTLTASGEVDFTDTTDASSLSTGSVVIAGGVAINKTLYMGLNIQGAVGVGGAPTSELNNFIVDGGTY